MYRKLLGGGQVAVLYGAAAPGLKGKRMKEKDLKKPNRGMITLLFAACYISQS